MKHIVLIGAPGCGKSTIARLWAKECLDYVHLSSGQIAADMAVDDIHTQEALQRGDYAPESAIRAEIVARIESTVVQGKSVVLEGFPRRLDQVVVLQQAIKNPDDLLFVHLVCPLYVALKRTTERGRKWDKPDAIASRYEAHRRDTIPMLEVLRNGGPFVTVPNHPDPPQDTIREIRACL